MRNAAAMILVAALLISMVPLVASGVAEADTLSAHSVGELQYPIDGYVVNGYYFGQYLPTGEYPERYHLGEDICKPAGTQVVAMADGVVKVANGNHASYGGLIIIEHTLADGKTYCSLYGHLKHSETLVEPEDAVSKGQPIGELSGDPADYGGPGSVPHLHFGIRFGAFPGEHALDKDTTSGWYWGGYGKKDPRTVSDWWIQPSTFIAPPPAITGVEPAQPWQSDKRERFSILGNGFAKDPDSVVTVKAPAPHSGTWNIPRENNTFIKVNEEQTRIDIDVQFHIQGTWTVWVTNPDGQKSDPPFPFEVKGKKPTACIPADLLDKIENLIEENPASQFYNASWGISKDQYKLMIAALAWAEVESAGYQAHSTDAVDVWHKDLPVDSSGFHFSTGLGPYQITLGDIPSKGEKPDLGEFWSNWKTIEKLNSTYALRSVLYRHKVEAVSVTTLEDLRVAMCAGDWYGYCYPTRGEWRTRWEQVTGTKWDDVSSSNSTEFLLGHPGLDWNRIKAQLIENENAERWMPERDAVRCLGFQKWSIPEEEGITNRAGQPVIIDDCLPTWSISAWKSMGTELRYSYYYTYHEDLGLEIWALARDPRYIFTRTYTTPTWDAHRPDNRGLKLTNSPVNIVDPGPGLAAKAVANVANILGAPYHGDAKGRHWAPSGEHSDGGARWATPEEVRHIGYRASSGSDIQKGIDSSGLIMWAYNLAYRPQGGYLSVDNPVWHVDADKQWADKTRMTQRHAFQGATAVSDFLQEYEADPSSLGLVPGDPIYFLDRSSETGNDHAAMYVGNGCIAHALPGSQGKVVHEKLTDVLARYRENGDWFRLVGLGRVVVREIDVVLVIDDSGSMRWNDPQNMRTQAAEVFINAMQPDDQVGVVAFTSSATTLWSIQPVGEDRQPIIDSLKALSSSGGTNLSRALVRAYEQLKSVESSGNRKAVVFLTDGVGTYNNEARMFGEKDWPIYVLGLGDQINERQLQDIADDSGGAYHHLSDPSQMNAIYNEIAMAIAGGETVLNVIQRMFQGQTLQQVTQIGHGILRAIIGVFWGGSMVDVTLIAPDGTVIDPSTVSPDVYHAKGLTYQMYQITNPLPGQWTIIMYGADLPPEGQDVTLQVSVVGEVATPSVYRFEYSVPDPITVASDVDIDVTFMTDEEKDIGYDGVRFRFEADGPGDVTFTATDSEGVEHTFLNNGFWGPSAGFDLPALYEATTTWTLNFLHKAGDYTIAFSLVEAPDGDVIADITETVTVTVKPLPANVSIDPDTLNLRARGQWITAYIELPEGYVAEDVDTETVELVYGEEEPLVADWGEVLDGVLMVKFDWATVAGWFEGLHDEEVELTVAGEVAGVDFEGTDIIRVINPSQGRGR